MTREAVHTRNVQVMLSERVYRQLIDKAKAKEQSRSEYIRAALLVAMAKDEREGKENG